MRRLPHTAVRLHGMVQRLHGGGQKFPGVVEEHPGAGQTLRHARNEPILTAKMLLS